MIGFSNIYYRSDRIPSQPKLLVINEDEIDSKKDSSKTSRPKRPHSQPPGRTRKSKGRPYKFIASIGSKSNTSTVISNHAYVPFQFSNTALQEIEKRRKSLELEKQKFFSDIIQGSRYSFTSGDQTHSILQKETQKCLDSVLKPDNFNLLKKNFNLAYRTEQIENEHLTDEEIKVRRYFSLVIHMDSCFKILSSKY